MVVLHIIVDFSANSHSNLHVGTWTAHRKETTEKIASDRRQKFFPFRP